jgi:3-deoxy-manno-octulosonate cytidylyltransferase (CMP-KDO synthetase)
VQAPAITRQNRAVVIVPARLGSTRMPRKMLRRDSGRYLFQHTIENLRGNPRAEGVFLATDSEEIEAAARAVGIEVLRTSPEHPSGTDRVFEAFRLLENRGIGPIDVVVNVQGDEPEFQESHLTALIDACADPGVEMSTLAGPIRTARELFDPNVVKVVFDTRGDALYFSRAPIPWPGESKAGGGSEIGPSRESWRHVGAYAFRPSALARFCSLPVSRLEESERLEQLRWLEAGGALRVRCIERVPQDINTEEQYALFLNRCQALRSS